MLLKTQTQLTEFYETYPSINQSNFQKYDWTDFYEGAVEVIPSNAAPLGGKYVDLCMTVDSNHAAKKWRRFSTEFTIYKTYYQLTCIQRNSLLSAFAVEFVTIKVGMNTFNQNAQAQ